MTTGFGGFDTSCPEGGSHEWPPVADDPMRHCTKCGVLGRGTVVDRHGEVTHGFLTHATSARAEFFQGLRAPESAHGKPRKAGS